MLIACLVAMFLIVIIRSVESVYVLVNLYQAYLDKVMNPYGLKMHSSSHLTCGLFDLGFEDAHNGKNGSKHSYVVKNGGQKFGT